ncbi:MAG: glycosyltransferase [Acetatifactor sp.]|nr:glycosyltransferase [Acetatifactor sp.]
MKKALFVINTLGHAGAETALLELLRHLSPDEYEVSLYVLTNQGELVHELPEHVKLLNTHYVDCSVLSKEGKKALNRQVLRAMLSRGSILRNFPYLVKNFWTMLRMGRILPDKLLWRVMSDGGLRTETRYDLAVAYLEGGSAYYVADHVLADKKVAFLHVDYGRAGYTRSLDKDCYLKYDKVFTVSDEVKATFLKVYPECESVTEVFHNIINQEEIRKKSKLPGGFSDQFDGWRILTVGRLTAQKAYEVSIEAMGLLKERGLHARWYVLGEGEQRSFLEEKIKELGLEKDFVLLGAVSNPYPYMRQADLYVHASRFEGKSIAIQEAQTLGKVILVSDCSGNREQVEQNVDGVLCGLTPEEVSSKVVELFEDREKYQRLGAAAAAKKMTDESEMNKLFSLMI